jgi:hypothetical protein
MVLPKVIDDAVAGARGPTLIKVHAHIMYFVLPIPPEVDGLSESSLVVHHALACTVIRNLQPREARRGSREGWLDRFFYFGAGAELEGGLTAGPLLLPGNPGTLAAS